MAKHLYKQGEQVLVSGDLHDGNYDCRVSSPGVVLSDQRNPRTSVMVSVSEIDGDRNVLIYLKPSLLTLA